MKNLYSIMPLDTAHLDEICEDIKWQYANGVSDCALFMVKLVPEGIPTIDKASMQCKDFALFRDRLAEMGLSCGILVQCTIGHGYALNQPSAFQPYVNFSDGKADAGTLCPYDEAFRDYLRDQFATIAKYAPKEIMVDDDFRLIYRGGKGCTCPMHVDAFNRLAGTDLTRDEIAGIVSGKTHPELREAYTDIYVETQKDALLGAAKAMREGINSVDPAIPGTFCAVGHTVEFAADIAAILAGKDNPVVVRINNGNYTPAGARYLSKVSYRAAQQIECLKGKADVVLAETDTCPQNRYSTGAQSLHSHFVASILEGAKGAKHWITRLATFEPQSGKAFRKILAKHRGLYDTLAEMVPTMRWVGCRIPLPVKPDYGLTVPGWYSLSDAWSSCVLERFGVPLYFSSEKGGAAFLEGNAVNAFTDAEIEEMLGGTVFLAADAIEKLESRGFAKDMGVTARPWKGARTSFERLYVNGNKANAQKWIRELVIQDERVQVASMTMHLKDGKDEIPLFPAVTVFRNDRGGRVIAFCGSPNTEFNYLQAFSFLTASRKLQMVQLLKESGNLPVYYPDDSEIYLKAAYLPDGGLFTAVFNISLDPLDEVPLVTEKPVSRVEMLTANGERVPCPFRKEDDRIVIEKTVITLDPACFILYE